MSEKERLMELIVDAENEAHKFFPYLECMKRIEETAAYLLEHGVLMPPVKVGDIVYIIYQGKVHPVLVNMVVSDVSDRGNRINVDTEIVLDDNTRHRFRTKFNWDSVGKSFFLTEEDAREALSKMQCKNFIHEESNKKCR